MTKAAIAFSSKDEVENSRQTVPHLLHPTKFDLWWVDGSRMDEGRELPTHYYCRPYYCFGGADAAIAWKLSTLLAAPEHYDFIGLAENDVLLQDGWFEDTMALFEIGTKDGLEVGAVSPRSYVDRVLIQRDGYAVMLNLGAGFVIFTREAAEIVLRTMRTAWWKNTVDLFAQLSGIDIRTYACFRGNETWTTTDWQFDAQLAAHGLASLALTPAKCRMIGQKIPLEQQGLQLTAANIIAGRWTGDSGAFDDSNFEFARYRDNLAKIRDGAHKPGWPGAIHRDGAGMLFFPHQLGYLEAQWHGTLELQNQQGFGPFAYRAGEGGASLSVRVSGTCGFLVDGGLAGAKVTIEDIRSGFRASPDLPPSQGQPVSVGVPGSPIPRLLRVTLAEGAVFCGLHTADQQMIDTSFRFDWSQLPEAK